MKTYYWKAYTAEHRIGIVSEVEQIVDEFGFIIDFKQYSDLTLNLDIEIEERKIDKLYSALTDCIKMDVFETINSESTEYCLVYLNISFAEGHGELSVELPIGPG